MKLIKEEVNQKNKYEKLFDEMLEYMEFRLVKYPDGTFGLIDLQGGNLGNIEDDRFDNALQLLDRLDIYYDDYFINPIADELKDKGIESFHKDFSIVKFRDELPDSEWDFDVLDMVINHPNDIDLNNCYREDDLIGESVEEAKENKIILNDAQKKKVLDYLFGEFDVYTFYKDKLDREWYITDDKSLDPVRSDSDDAAFPMVLVIDGDFVDALTKEFADKIISLKESTELDRQAFVSLVKLGDKPYNGYSILNDGNFVKRLYAGSDEDAISQFRDWIGRGGTRLKESAKLTEGTSNFSSQEDLPLYAFLTVDEAADRVMHMVYNDPEYDEEDDDKYYELEDKYYTELENDGYAVIDLDDGELYNAIDEVNDLIAHLAGMAYDESYKLDRELENNEYSDEEYDRIREEANEWLDASDYLDDLKLGIKPGYYEGAQLYLDGWDKYFIEAVPEDYRQQIVDAYNKIGKDFGLMKLGVAYHASNGETGYNLIKEDVSYTRQQLIDAVKDAYGFTNKEALAWIKKASEESKKAIVGGFRQNARRNFYDESLKESETLTERAWRYTLKSGIKLRRAIQSGDYEDIRQALIDCYDELLDKGFIDEYDHDDWTEEVRDYDFESDDDVDFELGQLYDLCDNIDVFVALDFDESLKEDWYVFEYESGANPYIAKSEKERDRILRKYRDRVKDEGDNTYFVYDREEDLFSIKEDTVKQGNAWVNKGKEGTHGKFKTKKAADAQRKAMFANSGKNRNFGENLKESTDMDIDEWVLTKIREANAPQMTVASYFDSSSWKNDIETRLTGGDKQPLKLVVAKWNRDNSNKMDKLKEYDITDDMTLGELENSLTKLKESLKEGYIGGIAGLGMWDDDFMLNADSYPEDYVANYKKIKALQREIRHNFNNCKTVDEANDCYKASIDKVDALRDEIVNYYTSPGKVPIGLSDTLDYFEDAVGEFEDRAIDRIIDAMSPEDRDSYYAKFDESLKESYNGIGYAKDIVNDDNILDVSTWERALEVAHPKDEEVRTDNLRWDWVGYIAYVDCTESGINTDVAIVERALADSPEGAIKLMQPAHRTGKYKLVKSVLSKNKNKISIKILKSTSTDKPVGSIEYMVFISRHTDNLVLVTPEDVHYFIDSINISNEKNPLKEAWDTDFDNKKVRRDIIGWWDDVERWNEENGSPYSIDNGDKEHATAQEVEEMLIAMWDMLLALRDEQKDSDEAKALLRRGKHIYNKYSTLSQFNESKKLKESKEEDLTADEIAYKKYQDGEYTYQDYVDVCTQEECEPLPEIKESIEEAKDGKFAGYTLFDDNDEVVDYICDDTHTDDEVSQIVADKYPTTKIILKQVFKLDGKDIKEVEEESTVLKPKAKVEDKKETAKDRVLAKKAKLKESNCSEPEEKPEFLHKGDWVWDDVACDWYDNNSGDYHLELVHNSELPFGDSDEDIQAVFGLKESADWTSDEILAIVDKLNADGIATTTNKGIADAYAANENPYRRFEVSKADDKDEWTIKVVWKDDTFESDDIVEESLENIPTITNLFGDYDF